MERVGEGRVHRSNCGSTHPLFFLSPQSLYLLIITNKGSNILEDLETLRLLAKVRGKRERERNRIE